MQFKRLTSKDTHRLRELNLVFAEAFEDLETYAQKPKDIYIRQKLDKDHIVVLVALVEDKVVGGLVAYILEKFEQERSETYLYDLAVAEAFRRQGIARALIENLKVISKANDSWVIFVQADRPDLPAIQLYQSMGAQEEPLHFDIPVD